ncbi:MAG: heparinase II/III family protein [Opitutales bacterium]
MLSQKYDKKDLQSVLLSRNNWRPFAKAADRAAWQSLPEPAQQALIQSGENVQGTDWPVLPATLLMDFSRTGNRNRYEARYFGRRQKLRDLTLAECMENRNRFLEDIVDGVWMICEESAWTIPAHLGWQKAGFGLPDVSEPYVDLFAGETSSLLAWVLYLLGDKLDTVSPLIVPRVTLEIQHRILKPLLEREDFIWTGFQNPKVNNWNPWIVSNWLATALFVEEDESRRLQHLIRAMRTVDNFIDRYPEDGGCDEGPMYWGRAGGSLYDCLEWLHSATHGAVDVFDEPLIQRIAAYIYRVQISDRYFVNFADSPPLINPNPGGVYGFGKRVGDSDMVRMGAWAASKWDAGNTEKHESISWRLSTLFGLKEMLAAPADPPLPRDTFLDKIELFTARDKKGSVDGFFVAAKGGHNDESHNHNDVGNVMVYVDGAPVLVDAGVETYTAKTFSPEGRYTIWTMQSAYHTLPTVNGVMQAAGSSFAARTVSRRIEDRSAEFRLDIAGAYPDEAHIDTWRRTVTLVRGVEVRLEDDYVLTSVQGPLTLNMLTPCVPELIEPGLLALRQAPLADGRRSGIAHLHFDAGNFDSTLEPITLEDAKMKQAWGERLTRIVFRVRRPSLRGGWTFRVTRP